MAKTLRYRIYETRSGFEVEDTKTGKCRGMGDGVDMFFTKTGKSIDVGTKAFYRALKEMEKYDQSIIGEAYFGR